MPTIGEFNARFAEIIEIPEGAIMKTQRTLRDAGLLTTGARGVNAPDFVPLDAARMLIAVLVTDRPSLAPSAVRAFGTLKISFQNWHQTEDSEHSALIEKLKAAETFEAMLAALIGSIAGMSPDLRSRYTRSVQVACTTSDMNARLECPAVQSFFSTIGPWLDVLGETDPKRRAEKVKAVEDELHRASRRASTINPNVGRITTKRMVKGDVIAEISELFQTAPAEAVGLRRAG
ncbi:hypothetical protein GCM10007881_64110 [Mesorhizobium huakuii]|uniref:hypothetical protein n=1 Tax=Mesorhizobium huakuii TaxID=28104 RepID=UPI00235DC0E2|nr:hypothetical protein [Mesorhizobium huakuii]GLQ82888.1 hypothetical protein GCM10007881_64110 [Mesorhizobium huakuii]